MNNWNDLQIKMQKIKNDFKDNLHLSTEYVDWLENFSKGKKIITTDDYKHDEESLKEKDNLNVYLLEALFELIDDYSEANFIEPIVTKYGQYYKIKHNGIGYEIGIDVGQGTYFYCQRQEQADDDSLEYKKLMSSVKLPSTIIVETKLEELTNYIEQLIEDDVPLNAIKNTTDNVIKKVKVKKGLTN